MMDDLRQKLITAIADACEIEEVAAEFGASAVLAVPEVKEALALQQAFREAGLGLRNGFVVAKAE
jgi:hypothetical protein